PRLEGWPSPRCSQCEKQECTCKVNTKEVTTVNTMKATTAKAVIRLTVELPPTHAAELAELLACHVSFPDFPWAEAIYDALHLQHALLHGSHHAVVFWDATLGRNAFLQRKQD